jgi:hypothetical protein
MSATQLSAAWEQLAMTEIPQGFSFEETDSGYILRQNTEGKTTEMRMTQEEFVGLKTTLDTWKDRRLSQFRARSGEVHKVLIVPVVKVELWPDAVGANILLTATTPSAQLTLSLPLSEVRTMAEALPLVLATIANPTKQ